MAGSPRSPGQYQCPIAVDTLHLSVENDVPCRKASLSPSFSFGYTSASVRFALTSGGAVSGIAKVDARLLQPLRGAVFRRVDDLQGGNGNSRVGNPGGFSIHNARQGTATTAPLGPTLASAPVLRPSRTARNQDREPEQPRLLLHPRNAAGAWRYRHLRYHHPKLRLER